MMDKAYILDQGLLERYVLGDLNDNEQKDVEQALISYPELKEDLERIELSLENLAQEYRISPSESVKRNMLKNISKSEPKVVALQTDTRLKRILAFTMSTAAVFLIGLMFALFQWNTAQKQLELVSDQNEVLNEKLDDIGQDLENTKALYALINNPDTEKYILRGNELMPEAKLISYVNDSERSVVVNTAYLPEIDEKHDYQMWADVEGEMINMGIIDTEKNMIAMNYIDNSESLNITIEPAGGSDHPTVSRLITNIYLK